MEHPARGRSGLHAQANLLGDRLTAVLIFHARKNKLEGDTHREPGRIGVFMWRAEAAGLDGGVHVFNGNHLCMHRISDGADVAKRSIGIASFARLERSDDGLYCWRSYRDFRAGTSFSWNIVDIWQGYPACKSSNEDHNEGIPLLLLQLVQTGFSRQPSAIRFIQAAVSLMAVIGHDADPFKR